MSKVIVTTALEIPDKKVVEVLSVVKGNTVRARWFGRDIAAGLKHLVGGEIKSYTDMLTKARDENKISNQAYEKIMWENINRILDLGLEK